MGDGEEGGYTRHPSDHDEHSGYDGGGSGGAQGEGMAVGGRQPGLWSSFRRGGPSSGPPRRNFGLPALPSGLGSVFASTLSSGAHMVNAALKPLGVGSGSGGPGGAGGSSQRSTGSSGAPDVLQLGSGSLSISPTSDRHTETHALLHEEGIEESSGGMRGKAGGGGEQLRRSTSARQEP